METNSWISVNIAEDIHASQEMNWNVFGKHWPNDIAMTFNLTAFTFMLRGRLTPFLFGNRTIPPALPLGQNVNFVHKTYYKC